ncbi:XRE family transcriptional regulator [Candidatus Borkfalkia ceftriaxoniphila]|uniref:XRE family transcriptional regulator n=2 Tax=Candidatus Borkfalkia ceftriaxoniphila TaxID=2508949 RepID=A0A4Q2KB29_9FIRM|nr:XRE family transcriptional regulator [Candidatus Borkfalkia ceftriaxoniphila]
MIKISCVTIITVIFTVVKTFTYILRYNDAMDIFTTKLKDARKLSGKTQKQLAEAIGTTDDSIYSWERGRSQPSIEYLRALCRVLEVTADYLIGLEDEDDTGTKINQ